MSLTVIWNRDLSIHGMLSAVSNISAVVAGTGTPARGGGKLPVAGVAGRSTRLEVVDRQTPVELAGLSTPQGEVDSSILEAEAQGTPVVEADRYRCPVVAVQGIAAALASMPVSPPA